MTNLSQSYKSDHDKVRKAFGIALEVMELNSEIDLSIWISTFWLVIARTYHDSGLSFSQFCQELDAIKKHYRRHWIDEE